MKKYFVFLYSLLLCCFQANSQSKSATNLSAIEAARQVSCDSALILLNQLEESKSEAENAAVMLQRGLTNYCLGAYDEALLNYQNSLTFFEKTENIKEQTNILNLIGTLHKKQGNMSDALVYFKKGLILSEAEGDSLGIGNSTNNIGLVYLQTNQFQEALDYFLISTEIKTQIGDTIGLSYNYDNLGITYSQMKNFERSRFYFDLAATYKEKIGDEVGAAIVKNNIGEMLLTANKVNEAVPYFEAALTIAERAKFSDFEQHVLNMLSETHSKLANYEKSLNYYKAHIAIKDSLFNDRKSMQVADIEAKYQNEKKERLIEAQEAQIDRNNLLLAGSGALILLLLVIGFQSHSRLKWKNRQLLEEQKRLAREAEMNAVISSQEKERNRFARDLHDGFGQLISTLNLNLKNLEAPKNKDEREKVFSASAAVLEEMYQELKNICFDLMPQTLIKHGLEAALNEFANRISLAERQHVEVNVFGLTERLTDLQEISLYRITQEWVNNILKYSDAQKIVIQITKDHEEITLLIEDDGQGFDKEKLTAGTGNGWRNMTSRSNLIHGELELDTNIGTRGNTLIMNATLQASNKKDTLQMAAYQVT